MSHYVRNMPPVSASIPWLPLLISLLAIAYCLYNGAGFGVDELCPTTGCALYSDFTIFGISLWWIGAAGLSFITLACLVKHIRVAYILALLGILADIPLLIILAFTAPCFLCMGVALFLVAIFFALRRHYRFPQERMLIPTVLVVWLCFFVVNAVNVLDGMAGPWVIHGPQNSIVQVNFSPSCPACRQAVASLINTPNIAYLPVVDKDGDLESIAYLEAELAKGTPFSLAFINSLDVELVQQYDVPFLDSIVIQARTLRNKSRILKQGFTQLPLISINGMPAFLSNIGGQSGASSGSGGLDLGDITYCEQDSEEPCDPLPE